MVFANPDPTFSSAIIYSIGDKRLVVGLPEKVFLRAEILHRKEPALNRSENKIVTGYAKMWPRELLEAVSYVELANDPDLDELRESGVYILYRDDKASYIGKTRGSLLGRLHFHATKSTGKNFLFWNFFSFFVVPEAKHMDELEGILIASVGTTTNSAEPKIKRIQIPKALRSKLRDISRRKFRTG